MHVIEIDWKMPARFIMKTCPCSKQIFFSFKNLKVLAEIFLIFFLVFAQNIEYNVYPLIPHFYIAKLGYAGVYLFSLFLLRNIDCGYSLEPPQRGGSNVYPQSMF